MGICEVTLNFRKPFFHIRWRFSNFYSVKNIEHNYFLISNDHSKVIKIIIYSKAYLMHFYFILHAVFDCMSIFLISKKFLYIATTLLKKKHHSFFEEIQILQSPFLRKITMDVKHMTLEN